MMRTRTLLVGGVIAIIATAFTWAMLWMQPAPPVAGVTMAAMATAEITRGTLVDTKTVTGTLGYGDLRALQPTLVGTSAMITWIAEIGATIERGEPTYRLDGQPAILLYGTACPSKRRTAAAPG